MTPSQRLHAAGLRTTPVREAVLRILGKAGRPLSHQEIARRPGLAGVDRVTLYRTLATLQKNGLLHSVRGLDGAWRFADPPALAERCAGNHVHFLCLACNQMTCLPEQPLPWVEEPAGAEVEGKQLIVYGRCARCKTRSRRGRTHGP